MAEIIETSLPGVGLRHELACESGERVGVIMASVPQVSPTEPAGQDALLILTVLTGAFMVLLGLVRPACWPCSTQPVNERSLIRPGRTARPARSGDGATP